MKKTLKTTTILLSILAIIYGVYLINKKPKLDPYEQAIQAIMQEESFIKSVRLQAETVKAKRDKAEIEKKLEGLRKQELELASSTSLE